MILSDVPAVSALQHSPSNPQTRYRAWLVDLDGTLYHQTWVRAAMAAELLAGHWSVIPLLQAFRRAQEELRQNNWQNGNCPYQQQVACVAEQFGLTVEHVQSMVQYWMVQRPLKWLRLFRRRQLIAEIGSFHRIGGRTALVSDYPAEKKLKALGADSIFDLVVANGELDRAYWLKPRPDGFLLAASRLGVRPEECLVLGDREDTDGEAARRAKMSFQLVT